LAYTLAGRGAREEDLHILLNMSEDMLEMVLPPVPGRTWHRAIDTGETSPADILDPAEQAGIQGSIYRVSPQSVVVFESRS
jgi:glycogen operon protein